ncbi:hypothetical protein [Luteimonas sp. TWI1416]|uniref:hypothetical protein n=1 Tax=unclassified Luteimonas TaxID=2629088 RepID=UPI003209D428
MIPFVFLFQLFGGIVGQVALMQGSFALRPAEAAIDHPSRPHRLFYRGMALLMCNLWSLLATLLLLDAVGVDVPAPGLSPPARVATLVLLPLPLLGVFYWLYVRFLRWVA